MVGGAAPVIPGIFLPKKTILVDIFLPTPLREKNV